MSIYIVTQTFELLTIRMFVSVGLSVAQNCHHCCVWRLYYNYCIIYNAFRTVYM